MGLTQLGTVPWSPADIAETIPEFLGVYGGRPLQRNAGGMHAPHMFALWFMLRQLRPQVVIESGVWKGQGTWLIEQAVPDAALHCIDIDLKRLEYRSDRAEYHSVDFGDIDWSGLVDPASALLFFDDHQDALERVHLAETLGFKKLIFEDNYPPEQGDCYSLKKAFLGSGHHPPRRFLPRLRRPWASQPTARLAGDADATYLRSALRTYYEFPPVAKAETTRWGDPWTSERYPTPPPILDEPPTGGASVFADEATLYTWMCFAELR